MAKDAEHIIVTCRCGQKMKAPAEVKGKTFKCVRCGEAVRVGEAPPAAAPPKKEKDAGDAPPTEPIGQLLIQAGLLTATQLEEALARQRKSGGRTFENLIALGHLTKEALHEFLSRQPGVATIELRRFEIDRKLVEIVPKEIAQENLVLPIDRLGKLLTVAMACPLDRATIEKVEEITGLKVKAVLCRLDDIHAAVKRYYPKSDAIRVQDILDATPAKVVGPKKDWRVALDTLMALPLDSDVVTLIRELALSEEPDLRMLAATAATDTSVAAALLRLANSPIYGLSKTIDSVPMAVAVLGKTGVLSALDGGDNTSLPSVPEIARLRKRACLCAEIAAALAKTSGRVEPGAAYTAGLLLELGSHALAAVAPDEYLRVNPDTGGVARNEAEIEVIGIGHCEAGYIMASRWQFPESLCVAIRRYADIEHAPTDQDLVHVVAIAAFLTSLKATPSPEETAAWRKSMTILALDHAALTRVYKEITGASG